jgi:hypothetical protein
MSLPLPVLAQQAGGGEGVEAFLLAIVFFLGIGWIGRMMTTKDDKAWLPRLILWAYLAKLLGSLARYYMVTVLYETGDSLTYHLVGTGFANVWRGLIVPVSTAGNPGTGTTEVITGFIYAIYTPTVLGGFLIFATLAFFGQLLFYAAFRPWFGPRKQKLYAMAVLFLPSLVFWPSSIGKDALMVFFLGLATYGASRLLQRYEFSSLLFIVPGLALAAGIRSHVAGILGLAIVLALLLGKAPKNVQGSPKRAIMILLAAAGAAAVLAIFSSAFSVTLEGGTTTQDPTAFMEDVSEQTSVGGSQITGGAVGSPSQLPLAIVTVLFRPLIHEGRSPQVILSALEGTALLLITIWKLPTMWRNKRWLREKPFPLLTFFYTGGFIIGFSAILNLGILARQRVQVLPMFLALIIGLGWDEAKGEDEAEIARPDRRAPRQPPEKRPEPAAPTAAVESQDAGNQSETAPSPSQSGSGPEPQGPATQQASGPPLRR